MAQKKAPPKPRRARGAPRSATPRSAPPEFTRKAVAALFLERQHLDRPRARRFRADRLTRFLEDTGGLQIDSINVVDRAHYITAWSRFGAYDRKALDRLTYEKRAIFEYWAHAACLVPASHFPAWRRAMLDYHRRNRSWGAWLRKNRKLIDAVETAIRDGGPQGTADFEHRKGSTTGWWNWKPAAHALDYLWMSGRTLVHSRKNFQKRYDLAERLMPEAIAKEPLGADEFVAWHIRRSLHAMGAATRTDLSRYLTFPRFPPAERRRVLGALVRSGEVREVRVAGSREPWWCLSGDLEALARASRRRVASRGTTFLSPFDSLMWHRDRLVRLFAFDYRIEVYTPASRRVHGYYVLPILHDGTFVGRVDAKAHRADGHLELRAVHLEPWLADARALSPSAWGTIDRAAVLHGIADCARSLAAFTGCARVSVARAKPASATRAIRAALDGNARGI